MQTINIFQIGDWVRAKDLMHSKNMDIDGFVVDNQNSNYLVICHPKTGFVVALPYIRYDFQPLTVDTDPTCIKELIDLALQLKDRKWFEDLRRRLPKVRP